MAAPSLHLPVVGGVVPSVSRSLHLSNVQQSVLEALQLTNPLPLAHGREALQVPAPGMWEGVQRPKQHEATRTRMSQLREWNDDVMLAFISALLGHASAAAARRLLMYKVRCVPFLFYCISIANRVALGHGYPLVCAFALLAWFSLHPGWAFGGGQFWRLAFAPEL